MNFVRTSEFIKDECCPGGILANWSFEDELEYSHCFTLVVHKYCSVSCSLRLKTNKSGSKCSQITIWIAVEIIQKYTCESRVVSKDCWKTSL